MFRMKRYSIETENIYFAGDLHGEFHAISYTINKYNLQSCAIIICGDIGIGFEKEEYYNQIFNKLTKTLTKRNIHLFLFRGNHDDKNYFDGEHFLNFQYIHIMPDYSVITSNSRNILCIGGATSIDRRWRKETMKLYEIDYMKHHSCNWAEAEEKSKKLYWENEPILFNINELKKLSTNNINIDTICTHTAPSFCFPVTKNNLQNWLLSDPSLNGDLKEERKICDTILNFLNENNHSIQNWYYGHFHYHNVEIIDDIKYTLLDMVRNNKIDLN